VVVSAATTREREAPARSAGTGRTGQLTSAVKTTVIRAVAISSIASEKPAKLRVAARPCFGAVLGVEAQGGEASCYLCQDTDNVSGLTNETGRLSCDW
jgi:hypothetical protein